MSLKDIINKHGYTGGTEGWFSLEDTKRIRAKGELEELGFRIPIELRKYYDISPEAELVSIKPVPEELKGLEAELLAVWERIHNPEDLTEY